jgi:hypothetical protein
MIHLKDTTLKRIALISGIICAIASILALILPAVLNPEPKTIHCNFSKCVTNEAVIYTGDLRNVEKGHAKDLTLSGRFNSEILVFTVNTNMGIIKKEHNKPTGSIFLNLQRLASGSPCNFNIITDKGGEISTPLQVSWGDKGKVTLIPQECDEKIQRGMDIMNDLSGLAKLSRKARQIVVRRNDN